MAGRKGNKKGNKKPNNTWGPVVPKDAKVLNKIPIHLIKSLNGYIVFAINNLLYVFNIEKKQFLNIDKSNQHTLIISSIEFTNDKKSVVTSSHDKFIKIWTIENDQIKLTKSMNTNKKIICTTLSNDNEIMVADKCGDVFRYSLVDDSKNHFIDLSVNKQSKQDLREQDQNLSLGHYSSITDIRFSRDYKYLLTGDRDEKVRVSNFPNTYDIERYCLSAEKYITKIIMPENKEKLMIMGSGDGRLYVFEFISGKLIQSLDFNDKVKDAIVIPQLYNAVTGQLVISLEGSSEIFIYQLDQSTEKLNLQKQLDCKSLFGVSELSTPISMEYVQDQIYITLTTASKDLNNDPYIVGMNATTFEATKQSPITEAINSLTTPTFDDKSIFTTYLNTIEKKQYRKYLSNIEKGSTSKDSNNNNEEEDDLLPEDLEDRPLKQIKVDI